MSYHFLDRFASVLVTTMMAMAASVSAEDCCGGSAAETVPVLKQQVENASSAPSPQAQEVPPAFPSQPVRRGIDAAVVAGAPVKLGVFSDPPTDAEIILNRRFPERLAVIGATSAEENRALVAALKGYPVDQDPVAFTSITEFLASHPQSAWKTSLLTNMGLVYNRLGYFSRAMACWQEAWDTGRGASEGPGKQLADLALAELSQLNAWVGRQDALDGILAQSAGRPMSGIAREMMVRSQRAREVMRAQPGISFKCGPYALEHIAKKKKKNLLERFPAIEEFNTTPQGTSLLELAELSGRIGVPMQIVKGGVSADMPLPAVIHWKLNHFSVITKVADGKVLIQDTTRQMQSAESWLPLAAVREEASGYFLIPEGPIPAAFGVVEADEAGLHFGRGFTSMEIDSKGTSCFDVSCGGGGNPCGMASYTFVASSRSLRVEDMPLFYDSPRNGTIGFHVAYNERESLQPTLFTTSNFGPRWSFNWVDSIIETTNSYATGQTVTHSMGGGGGVTRSLYNSVGSPEKFTGSTLNRTGDGQFTLIHLDGSRWFYTLPDSTVFPRRVYVTRMEDPSGNAITLTYQQVVAGLRLAAITDSLGQSSVFSYEHADPLKITRITDPFGRYAVFAYGEDGYLKSITDAVGIVSSFTYENGDAMAALITPYGTTRFRRNATDFRRRWIEATDPNGDTERLESLHGAPGIPETYTYPTAEAGDLSPLSGIGTKYNDFCSYYWDKKAYKSSPGIYTDAMMYKWVWADPYGNMNQHAPYGRILCGVKPPREEAVWFQYPGQNTIHSEYGITLAKPRLTARILDDGSVQRTRATYSASGQVTSIKDPLGRITEYTYAANGIDLLEVKQRVDATTTQTLATATYNAAHQPLTMTDAAGRTTTITYNAFGQTETVTNAKNELTRLIYDANGYLTTIRDPLLGDRTIAYDGYGRSRTVTAVDGHFTTTDYDGLNRPLRVTYPDDTFEQIIYSRLDAEWLRDRQGRWTHQFYDSLGRLVATRDPLGRTSFVEWCACGKPASLTDALGRKTTWTLDIQGRVTVKTYADGRGVTMTYQPKSGRLATVTDALGQITTYQYFLDNQVQSVAYNAASTGRTTPGMSFTYDAVFGRLATIVDGTGTTAITYQPVTAGPAFTAGAGRLASIDGPLANDTVSFVYDELGRILNRSLELGATAGSYTQAVTYDIIGRMATQTNELGSFGYAYVGNTDRLETVTLPGGMTTTMAYQAMMQDFRLASITHRRLGGALISSHAYTYSLAGAITSWAMQTDMGGSSTYQFTNDEADQLVSALRTGNIPIGASAIGAFRYDAGGNRLTTHIDKVVQTHSYNNLNQLTSTAVGGLLRVEGHLDELSTVIVNGVNAKVTADKKYVAEVPVTTGNNTITVQATDASNNVAQQQWQITGITGTTESLAYDFNGNITSDGTRTFEWDAKDRLTAIVQGALRSEFTYDGLGRRVRMVEKSGGTVISDKRFLWVGTEIVQERETSSNVVTKRFNMHGVLDMNGALLYLRDHLGSVREVMDTVGSVRARYDYEVYGKRQKVSGDLNVDAGFTGHWQHTASGLALTWYRAYDPQSGRWISRDPLGESAGLNLYAYVHNQSVLQTDPLGLLDPGSYATAAAMVSAQAATGAAAAAGTSVAVVGALAVGTAAVAGSAGYAISEYSGYGAELGEFIGEAFFPLPGPAMPPPRKPPQTTVGSAWFGDDEHCHHRLPQEFKAWFEAPGRNLKIDSYTRPLPMSTHMGSPGGIHWKCGFNYNGRWAEFIRQNPNATAKDVLEFLKKLELEFFGRF